MPFDADAVAPGRAIPRVFPVLAAQGASPRLRRITCVRRVMVALMLIATMTRAGMADAGAQAPRVLFEQPAVDDLARSFLVPLADPQHPDPPPEDRFVLVLWGRPGPKRSDGTLVPTSWSAGDKTGFYPTLPLEHQLGFEDRPGTTTVQAQGGVVGAYLNAQEVSTDFGGLTITPAYLWSDASAARPFSDPAQALLVSLEVQVPAASAANRPGSFAYVQADLQFTDRVSGTKLSYGSGLFFNGHGDWSRDSVEIGFDTPSQSIMINAPDEDGSPTLRRVPGSDHFTGTPWRGWRTFSYAITRRAFSFALDQARNRYPNANASQDPADYRLTMFHLNAEVKHSSGPAELGWSMRNARIVLQDGGS